LNSEGKTGFRGKKKELKAYLMHVPQGSMPERLMSPSCPKLHTHLKIRNSQLNFLLKIQFKKKKNPIGIPKPSKKLNELKSKSVKGLLTAAPTDRANVPNISDKGTSPPCTKPNPISQPNYLHMQITNHA